MWRSLFTTYWFGFGVGRGTGRLLFTAAGRVFAFGGAIRFTLPRGVAFTFAAPVFVFARLTLARFALIDLFVLPLAFAFSLVFFGFGFGFGLFSLVFTAELTLRFSAGSSGVTFSDDSPALARRLMSIATVCPVFTTSPARGS
jgi:hypothetical protein